MSQEPNNYRNKALEEILSQYTDEEIEEAINNAIANGDEYLKQMKVESDLELFEKYLGKDMHDEFAKALVRGKVKENAEFIGTVRNEARCQQYEMLASLAKLFGEVVEGRGEPVEISYDPPHPTCRDASVAIDFPTVYTISHSLTQYIAKMMELSSEVAIAECWSDDPSEAGTLGVRITFEIDDVWS